MAIDPDYPLASAGLRPEEAVSPTIEFEGATPVDEQPLRSPRRRHRLGVYCAIVWLALVVFIALFHSFLPLGPYDQYVGAPKQPPCFCIEEPFGTDALGRSVTSRLAVGARQSLTVALFSVAIGMLVGSLIGVLAGYARGWTDRTIGLFVNAGLAFPPLVLLLAFAAVLRPSLTSITMSLAVLFTFPFVRLGRAHTLGLVNREFVLAARASGARQSRILWREILPNVALPLVAFSFVLLAAAMVAEGSLSFLGLGVPPPAPSWGGMIAAGRANLSEAPELVFVPCVVLVLTVMAFNTLGDAARRRFEGRDVVVV